MDTPRPAALYSLPMADDVRREILGWEQFGGAGRELASTVVDDGYRPDLLLAIAHGGLLIAGVMSYALGMKNCCVINVEFYTGVDERLDVPVILPPHLDIVDLSGATSSSSTTSPTPARRSTSSRRRCDRRCRSCAPRCSTRRRARS